MAMRLSEIQESRNSRIQEFRNLGIQEFRNKKPTPEYLSSLTSDVCVFNIFKNLEVGICFKIQIVESDIHISFKIYMIVIACLLLASGSVS